MRVKRTTRWALAVLATLVAFAQFVVAAQPCRLAHDPATPAQHQMTSADGCEATPMDQPSCVAQCLGQDESASPVHPLFDALMAPAPLAFLDFTLKAERSKTFAEPLAPPGSRSLQILYCSYQS